MSTETPRIYVDCLSSYNAGRAHGEWIDCDQSAEDIQAEIGAMLKASKHQPAEDWAIHDHEWFQGYNPARFSDLETVAAVAELIAEHGEVVGHAMAYFGDLAEVREQLADRYRGPHKSLAEYLEDSAEVEGSLRNIPAYIKSHIDWKAMASDLECGSYNTFDLADGMVAIFQVE